MSTWPGCPWQGAALLSPGRRRSCFLSPVEKLEPADALRMLLVLLRYRSRRLGKGALAHAAPGLLLSQAGERCSSKEAFCCPCLVIPNSPVKSPENLGFFLFPGCHQLLFPITTSGSRSNASSAALTPGETLLCCPGSWLCPSNRCATLPPPAPTFSSDLLNHTSPISP